MSATHLGSTLMASCLGLDAELLLLFATAGRLALQLFDEFPKAALGSGRAFGFMFFRDVAPRRARELGASRRAHRRRGLRLRSDDAP